MEKSMPATDWLLQAATGIAVHACYRQTATGCCPKTLQTAVSKVLKLPGMVGRGVQKTSDHITS